MNNGNSDFEGRKSSSMYHKIENFSETPIYYLGPTLDKGQLPAFFYFSLSGVESLTLSPYNLPVLNLSNASLRVFSLTIPCHGEYFDKFKAMECWYQKFINKELFLEIFFNNALKAIDWLIDQKIVDAEKIAVGGLSRGAFIATHLASLERRIKYVLGYAPLTTLTTIAEFDQFQPQEYLRKWDLIQRVDHLLHLNSLRYYCGLHDVMIGTKECFSFVELLSQRAYEKRVRQLNLELLLRTSLGHKGHGTSQEILLEGSEWIKNKLLY